jgi:hypothetical protein
MNLPNYLIGSLLIALTANATAADLQVARFSASDITGWKDKPFRGTTEYAIVKENGQQVLKAHSRHAASGLIKEISIDAKKMPLLRWSWKIEHSLKKEDITKKKGDDFAARIYVVFPRLLFWQTRAVNYVWAHRMAKGSHIPSPYTNNNMIIAVESGDEKAGTWVKEERNILEDYRNLFGEEPPDIGAIAIMTDTDDTEDEVTAWYGDIFLSGTKTKKPPP